MKKLALTLLASLTLYVVNAQIEQSTIFVGTTSNLSLLDVRTGPNSSTTYFNISVQGGYFLVDNLMIGLDLSATSSHGTSVQVGAFTRYYPQGKFFLGAGFSTTSFSTGNNNLNQMGLEGGYVAFITKNISVEPALVYTKGFGDYSNFGNFGLRIGFGLYLNRD
ncbi:MAG: hypothetical protein ACKO96_06820 [Flammeovirgaceae bacterium]